VEHPSTKEYDMRYFFSRSLICLSISLSTSLSPGFGMTLPVSAEPLWPALEAEVYLDTAYAWESAPLSRKSSDETLAPFNSRLIHPVGYQNNTFQINTAQLTLRTPKNNLYRASVTLQAGTIALASWPEELPLLQEAYVGFNLLPTHSTPLWLDTGIFLTHIGSESILPRYNKLSLLSLISVFEPYFQSGLRLSYDLSAQIALELHLLNGYGTIIDNNPEKSVGWKVQYQPFEQLNLSLTGLAGNEQGAGEAFLFRQYHNLNLKYAITEAVDFQAQADLALEGSGVYHGAQATLSYQPLTQLGFSARVSSFQDPQEIISPGVEAYGITLGSEYKPTPQSYVRLEARQLFLLPASKLAFGLPNNPNGQSSTRNELLITTGLWF
jgi:hypothetical protein